MKPSQQEQTLYQRFDMIEKNIQHVVQQIDFITDKVSSFQNALALFSEVESSKDTQKESLVEITDGIFIPVHIAQIQKVVVTVGSEVAVQKTPKETIAVLHDQISVLEKYKHSFEEQLQSLEKELDAVQSQIQQVKHV